jgi:hypothetical protein
MENIMATLTYGPDATTVTIDDRALAHLQYVIFQRYRRHEPFVMTIVTGEAGDRQRRSTWMTPGAPVAFAYDDETMPQLDRVWLEDLMKQSYSGNGLVYSAPLEGEDELDADAAADVLAEAGAIVGAAAETPRVGRARTAVRSAA